MPLGPEQSGDAFYAGARLGCSTLGVIVINDKGDKLRVAACSRVHEKSAPMASLEMGAVLAELERKGWMEGVEELTFWSDTGPSFRAWLWLAELAMVASQSQRTVTCNFLLEKHGKNQCDGWFSVLSRRRFDASCKETLDSVGQVVTATPPPKNINRHVYLYVTILIYYKNT